MAEHVADLKYITPLGDLPSFQYGRSSSYKWRREADRRPPNQAGGGGDADQDVSVSGGRAKETNLNVKQNSVADI